MSTQTLKSFAVSLWALSWTIWLFAQEGIVLRLLVSNLKGRPIPDVQLTTSGRGSLSPPTTASGRTHLQLDPRVEVGSAISLVVLQSKEWVMLTPQVIVPAAKVAEPVRVQLMKRSRFRAVVTGALDKVSQARTVNDEITEEQRRKIIEDYAKQYGLRQQQLEQAIQSFGETKDPFDQGLTTLLMGAYAQAESSLTESYEARKERYEKTSGELVEVSRVLGQTLLRLEEQGDLRGAHLLEEGIREILKRMLGEEHPDPLIKMDSLTQTLYAHGDLNSVHELFEKVRETLELVLRTKHPDILITMDDLARTFKAQGLAYWKQGRLEEAIRVLRRASELDPQDASLFNHLCAALSDQGQLDEAIMACRIAIQLDPDLGRAHYDLGSIFSYQGKPADAIAAYERAIELNPNEIDAYVSLGEVYEAQGKQKEAERAFARADEIRQKQGF